MDADPGVIYRIANVSNGFPYYVHLLTEHLLWTWYEDVAAQQITMTHLHEAFAKATDAVHADLRKSYDKATRGREQAVIVLWAAADAFDSERTTDSIWGSYLQICDTMEVESLDKQRFLVQLRNLKTESHGSILIGVRSRRLYFSGRRWYVGMSAWQPHATTLN